MFRRQTCRALLTLKISGSYSAYPVRYSVLGFLGLSWVASPERRLLQVEAKFTRGAFEMMHGLTIYHWNIMGSTSSYGSCLPKAVLIILPLNLKIEVLL